VTRPLSGRAYTAGALLLGAFFLATSFRHAWNRDATDFRNYYTAAVLVRQSQPLRNYYDWTWFQRRMNKVGIQRLGSYVPQTPLAMIPLLPISNLPIQTAKRLWLLANLGFLGATFWLLSRITHLGIAKIALLAFLGFGTLHFNFLFGQYYVLLLFLITAALYCLERGEETAGGVLFSTAFALKLYGAPFLLYLVAKRRWRAVAAMVASVICFLSIAVAIFGWSDILYFGGHILPRAVAGETIDPYHSLNNTLATLLRRSFVMEPELNPHPLWNAVGAFFFLRSFLTLLILILPLFAVIGSDDLKGSFAFFALAILLASPNMGSYAYVLALLPVALLLDKASPRATVFLLLAYLLLGLPMNTRWSEFFPKLWLILALFLFSGWHFRHLMKPAPVVSVMSCVALLSVVSTRFQLAANLKEPEHNFERIAIQPGTIFSSSPAVLTSGIAYQAMSKDHYVLRWLHGRAIEEFTFDGHVIDPVAESADGPIRFDLLLDNRRASSMLFDVHTRRAVLAKPAKFVSQDQPEDLPSPDRQWIVTTKLVGSNTQLFLTNVGSSKTLQITGGSCSSWSAVWELDSKGIVFASDCNRGVGCPALYRARFENNQTAALAKPF